MSNKTRKYLWPALVMSLALVGVLAAFVALSTVGSTPVQAHDPCDGLTDINEIATCEGNEAASPHTHDTNGNGNGNDMMDMPKVTSSSDSGSATVELKLKITLTEDVPVGGAIVLYLEDDYQEPDSISASDVYFVVDPGSNNTDLKTGNGARVYATQNPEIDTDDHFTKDKKDIDIRVSVPDLCTTDTPDCQDLNGLMTGDTVTLVIQKSAGIKNPPEEGSHSTGYLIIGPAAAVPPSAAPDNQPFHKTEVLRTWAKISLSDVDNSRGYEMTVTGSGFNNGTTADVYVLGTDKLSYWTAKWWETLDCDGMKAAMKAAGVALDGDDYCFHYTVNDANMTYPLGMGMPDFEALTPAQKEMRSDNVQKYGRCGAIIEFGTKTGGALVGSDDKVTVTFEVTAPTFIPGNNNYICMVDGEGRASNRDVEDFKLEPSIKVVPASANSGDTVNVFAQDYHNEGEGFTLLKIAGQMIGSSFIESSQQIGTDGSGSVSFEVPGGFEGVLRVDALWGDDTNGNGTCQTSETTCISEDSKITIAGAQLNASKTEVLPNETITITGNGFGSQSCIAASDITLDNVPVMVDEESLGGNCDNNEVEVSNSGQFVATIVLWRSGRGTNPGADPRHPRAQRGRRPGIHR